MWRVMTSRAGRSLPSLILLLLLHQDNMASGYYEHLTSFQSAKNLRSFSSMSAASPMFYTRTFRFSLFKNSSNRKLEHDKRVVNARPQIGNCFPNLLSWFQIITALWPALSIFSEEQGNWKSVPNTSNRFVLNIFFFFFCNSWDNHPKYFPSAISLILENHLFFVQAESAIPRAAMDSGLNYCKGLFHW